jgi:hypothetical protein
LPKPRRIAPVFLVLALIVLVSACTSSSPPPSRPRPFSLSPSLFRPATIRLRPSGPVPVPATGALVGAWVKAPGQLTQSSRVTAVTGLTQQVGRQLDLVNTYRRMTDLFPMPSDYQLAAAGTTLVVSWSTPGARELMSGRDDPEIVAWAQRFASFGHPILLRMRWEMDRPNLRASMGSGADFVAAWNHVRAIFRAEHVTNVSWVWCPTANGFTTGVAQSYYPGDANVDWICVDVYASSQLEPLPDLLAPFLTWAVAHPKPILIGEFGVADAYPQTQRAAWLRTAAATFEADSQIKGVCYFDSDPVGAPSTLTFALPPDSPAMAAFTSMVRMDYFNAHHRPLS